ncbi:MAG TPA: VIT1/CCC1 family protein [Methanomicrobiales archaeon]|nr:VIT1/CCC1 family protein [Methanomicrobiales archaeon]
MTAEQPVPGRVRDALLRFQQGEITEHHIYLALAEKAGESANRKVLADIGAVELAHYRFFHALTGADLAPGRIRIAFYLLVYRIFGITFAIRFMERGEEKAQRIYREVTPSVPGLAVVIHDEEEHEKALVALIDEQRLKYTGSIVLGLNDALVELTGTLAGLTLALQNTRVIAMAGLITGIAAALSMGSAEYLSTKAEGPSLSDPPSGGVRPEARNPVQAATYTLAAYILAVILLVAPFLVLGSYLLALGVTILVAVIIIVIFAFYISVTRGVDFRGRFLEMAGISLGVALLSFLLGLVVRTFLGVSA